jgi:hypothetical protein
MKVNVIPFLTTISKNLQNRTANWVKSQTQEVCAKCLSEVIQLYNLGGLKITNIRCDIEFRTLMDPMATYFQIKMN